jgi:radical SAM superfamily enzyme YgiQ (UPF0313 family)
MKALLVYPVIPETYWSFKYLLKIVRRKAAHIPLGLLTIASMLPKQWQLRLVDMNVEPLSDQALEWADMVLIGAMVVQQDSVKEVVDRCKQLGKLVVAGGPLFTSTPEKFGDVDHLVLDEAEITLKPFLDDLEEGKAQHLYTSTERPDMSRTPLPKWDLINMRHYASMSVQYSRGCPYDCEFCDIVKLNGRVPRVKPNAQMLAEFEALYTRGWRGSLFVVDDNFIGNRVKVKSLLRELIPWQSDRQFPFMLYTEASVNLAQDEELMNLMSQAGFTAVFLGLETPEPASLVECGKHQNCGVDLEEAVKSIQRHGMEVMGGFIVGFDNDPPNIFDRQIKFIQNTGVVKAMIGILNAIPGTKLYKRLQEEGRLIENFSGNNCDGQLNFMPKMDPAMLKDGYQKVLECLYSPREYYFRVSEFLKLYKPTRHRKITRLEVTAFFNSILYLGILDKWSGKVYYWRMLIKAFIFHRKSFGDAVSQMIFGYHFRKLLGKK